MDKKESKILITVLILIWGFTISAAGFYVMSYMSDLSFNMKWLLNFIFSTPVIMSLTFIAVLWKKRA